MKKTIKLKNVEMVWDYDFDEKIKSNFSNRQLTDELNTIIQDKIKPKIENGISPVDGERMFQKYKNPKQYPGKQKQSNKPNLKLTGEMLYNYVSHEGPAPMTATMGIHKNDASPEVLGRATGNQFGTQGKLQTHIASTTKDRKLKKEIKAASKGIPARPFVPQGKQTFTRDIILEIRKAFAYCLDQAIKRGKNK